ncbi:glycosyltransferase family 4 protein [Leptothoe spongobia]|uniref:Glycosyltransferase family 4 protein n=1 Tax=Leptothoe spongobia TAU-MAC 1115 TaxID=1967444 RepID=A0A947DHR6_9CYAN|nr:glycosyltransferase family 4 protein [Leptothoe spongobia]MBT9317210.1 glycosyltransferase family 4 protein [Leptothoe spongobia TAU-MAC 1115]
MKIAVVGVKELPPHQGGIERACAELYPRMVQQGHSVDLYARASSTKLGWFEQSEFQGVRVISMPAFGKRGVDALVSSALGSLVSSYGYDVVHFHALGPAMFSIIPYVVSPRTKIVVTCHGLDWQRAKWGSFAKTLLQFGERSAVRCADEMIVVSQALCSYFEQTYQRPTHYVPNASAPYAYSDPSFQFGQSLGLSKQKYIVFLGRLVPEKSPDLLIQAFQQLRPAGWKLALVGGTSDTSAYTQNIRTLANDDPEVVFTGELRGEKLAEVMRGAGLFVLPSYVEGMPLAMLEAMMEGIPVLASDIAPHQQLLDKERGLLFETGSIDDCAQQLNWAVQHPTELQKIAKGAQDYAQLNHSWERITSETLGIYDQSLLVPSIAEAQERMKGVPERIANVSERLAS